MAGGTITTVAAALLLALVPSASAAIDDRMSEGEVGAAVGAPVPSADRVIVEWAPGTGPAERGAAREEADVDFAYVLGQGRFQLVETEAGQTPGAAVRELEADPAVVLAERDAYLDLDALPDDPLLGRLWGLRNTGLGIDGFVGARAGADIDVSSAWERTVGTPDTIVADLDSGYRFDHPDLSGVAWTNPDETTNGLDDDGNGIVDDVHGADFVGADATEPATDGDPTDDDLEHGGHGVHTAGTIGAAGDDGIGITGVAQDVRLMPLRVCSSTGADNGCATSAVVRAIHYAGAHGARAANMSFGGEDPSPAVRDAMAANPQTLFVISAGNEGVSNEVEPHYPCVFDPRAEGKSTVDNVICVAATDQADRLAEFSNWGANTVDLGAPGTQTLSTFPVTYVIDEDFADADFDTEWSTTGADGGFVRTDEAPPGSFGISSFGISDSPGAAPLAGSVKESTLALTMSPGFHDCELEYDRTVRRSAGAVFWTELRLGGLPYGIGGSDSRHFAFSFYDLLKDGGELELAFRYEAGPEPKATDGVWIDNLELHCMAQLGEPGGYAFMNGTSMATPHVTGAAALLFSLRPTATVTEVRRALLASVDPLPSLAGRTTSGGRLDVGAAADLLDGAPPPPPTLTATGPASPGQSTRPLLIGSAQRGTAISVYAGPACVGAPLATGTAAQLAAPGIEVGVASGATTQLSAKASDLVPLDSDCSAPISYTQRAAGDPGDPSEPGEVTPAPVEGPGSVTAPAAPALPVAPTLPHSVRRCVVPKLSDRTLAGARRALRRAGCRLARVRRPSRRRRRAALVVRSSRPAAGRRAANGSVELRLGRRPKRARASGM